MAALLLVILILLPVTTLAEPVHDSSALKAQSARTEPLTISEVLARIELTHPLLRATGVERMQARAKILKALGRLGTDVQEQDRGRSVSDLEFPGLR